MKKILLLLTGGTIGSCEQNGIITTNTKSFPLLNMYKEKYGNDCIFDVKQPLNILSENIGKHHWEIIVNYILSLELSHYNGIIVTHGSDTLSYSSAMLSMCLCHIDIPLIITASNYIPADKRSNALENFRAAVILINELKKGVFTVFKNDDDSCCKVYLPTRLNEADRIFDRFSSFDLTPFGDVSENGFKQIQTFPSLNDIYRKRQPITDKLSLKNNILMIRPYPSMDYRSIILFPDIKAVLHITYHSSSAKTDGENSALALLQQCKSKKVDFYCASFKNKNDALYQTSDTLIKNGAVPLFNISNESAYAKLLLCFNINNTDKNKFMKNNIYFEEIK